MVGCIVYVVMVGGVSVIIEGGNIIFIVLGIIMVYVVKKLFLFGGSGNYLLLVFL